MLHRNDKPEAPERSSRREQRPPARKDHRTETAAREMTIATPEATAEQQPPSARDAKESIGIINRSDHPRLCGERTTEKATPITNGCSEFRGSAERGAPFGFSFLTRDPGLPTPLHLASPSPRNHQMSTIRGLRTAGQNTI